MTLPSELDGMDMLYVADRCVRRFVSAEVGTNMYVLTEGAHALVIDPHLSEEALSFLGKSTIEECTVFLTHEHPDHTWGLHALQEAFRTVVVCQKACAGAIADRENNRPTLITAMLSVQDSRNGTNNAETFLYRYEEHVYTADVVFGHDLVYAWGRERFVFTHTPGHSEGSCCILWNDAAVFTGDSLLRDVPVITRLPGGSTSRYRELTLPYLKALNRELLVLPGHGAEFRLKDI